MSKEFLEQKVAKIQEFLDYFDKNTRFYDILENGRVDNFLLARDYLYLKSKLKTILEEKEEK